MNRLDNDNTLSFGTLLGKKLALDLDAGDKSSTKKVITLLEELPLEVILTVFREQIGLERVVKHKLDNLNILRKTLSVLSQT